MQRDQPLDQLARRQWGAFSREQAFALGFGKSLLRRRLLSGDWVEIQHRVYRMRGCPVSWRQQVRAATLSLGEPAMASHLTAAFLWDLEGVGFKRPAMLALTVPRDCFRRVRGGVVHRSLTAPNPPAVCEGIPLTPIARTIFDLAGILKPRALDKGVDSALRRHRTLLAELERELSEHGRGHRGATVLSSLLEARGDQATESGLEDEVWFSIRNSRVPPPALQYRVRNREGVVIARADLAWPDYRVLLLVHSKQHHTSLLAWENDLRQVDELTALGWMPMHVTSQMLKNDNWLVRLEQALVRGGCEAVGRPW